MLLIFLSTPSARRATPEPLRLRLHHQISIHALREEGDRVRRRIGSVLANFYPRPPRGGRHAHSLILPSLSDFYPRPPRGGRLSQMFLQCRLRNFYPRPPRPYSVTFVFLSTPSARRATVTAQRRIEEVRISIHALREEGDSRLSMMRCTSLLFLSTPSARRATRRRCTADVVLFISIHALREEGDSKNRDKISIFKQIIQHSARI